MELEEYRKDKGSQVSLLGIGSVKGPAGVVVECVVESLVGEEEKVQGKVCGGHFEGDCAVTFFPLWVYLKLGSSPEHPGISHFTSRD